MRHLRHIDIDAGTEMPVEGLVIGDTMTLSKRDRSVGSCTARDPAPARAN
jgi:hypothetical protein